MVLDSIGFLVFTFALYFIYFLGAAFLAFYIPGSVLLGKKFIGEKTFFEGLILSLICGIVLFGYQAVLFGYLSMRFGTYIYIASFLILWLRSKHSELPKMRAPQNAFSYALIIIFVLGIVGQIQQFFLSGFIFEKGMYMLTVSSDDAFWHTSLINQLIKRLPPFEPGMTNVLVHNYHYWANIIIAELVRVFHLPLLATQYQYVYLLLSFLLGGVAYTLGKTLKLSNWGVLFLVYIQYFASDVIYLFSFIATKLFVFSVHPLEDGTMFHENPPRAFASVITLGICVLLFHILKKRNTRLLFVMIIMIGSLIGFKVHNGIVALCGTGVLFLYFFIRKEWKYAMFSLLPFLISALLYLPVNSGAGGLGFYPFEMARMFVVQPGLGLSQFELARRVYMDHTNIVQALRMDITMLLVFLLAQFGIKNIGFIAFPFFTKKISLPFIFFLYTIIISGILLGTLFLQPVAGADIFNFYLAASVPLGVLAAIVISKLSVSNNKYTYICLLVFIMLSTVPRWLYKMQSISLYSNPPLVISNQELEAMEFVKKNTSEKDVVLVFNKGQWDSMFAYVSIFTNREMFLSGQIIMGRHGISSKERTAVVEEINTQKNPQEVKKLLKENNIGILYFYNPAKMGEGLKGTSLEKIFSNDKVTVFKVQ